MGKKGLQLKKLSIFLVSEQNNLCIFIIAVLTVAGLVSGRSPPYSIRENYNTANSRSGCVQIS